MKLLYVVQAYGHEVFGGAESHCRMMAERMAARGHNVEVLTSCATTYYDWANHYSPGTSVLDGVTVHRLAVPAPRDHEKFGPLGGRVLGSSGPVSLFLQQTWVKEQGPYLPELPMWLWNRATNYDVVIFFTYLYYPTVAGLPVTSGRVPTVLHPLSHDEPPFYLPVFDTVLRLPTGLAFSVEEDAALNKRRFHPKQQAAIVGIGTELDQPGDAGSFRSAYGLEERPYVACVGRLDPQKGSDELYDMFVTYKERNPGPLALVLVGEPVKPMPPHPDVVVTGFVDQATRNNAVAGAAASMHPSYFESFSMVLTEAWAQRRPAIVNGRCEVFAGQAHRSGGALPYTRYTEFEAALQMVLGEPGVAQRQGDAGRAYVERRYQWDTVLDRYERLLEITPAC